MNVREEAISTGAIYTPTTSGGLPVGSAEIAVTTLDAGKAGAAILHSRGRSPQTGRLAGNPEAFLASLPAISSETSRLSTPPWVAIRR